MNSLDVVPNSIAQVAAAIEEKRAEQHRHHRHRSSESKRCKPGPLRQRSVSSPARSKDIRRQRSYTQGRAFAAPRQQSLDRQRAEQADLDLLRQALDASPRKQRPHHLQGLTLKKVGSNISFATIGGGRSAAGTESPFHAMAFRTPPPPPREPRATTTPGSGAAEGVESLRARMRRMGSWDTLRSQRSLFAGPWPENGRPLRILRQGSSIARSRGGAGGGGGGSEHGRPLCRAQGIEGRTIAPHVLGLSSGVPRRPSFEVVGMDAAAAAAARPATGQGFRERLDRSRFEFKAVRRKGSVGGMRERGWGWWEQMRPRAREREREREREDGGWI
ncbi:hypothetical protein B0A55_13786 [Friedmanniomyces simplex]|uniref:Uncharacterized protein n=1 Tax=Friedmanniomyces simplex TaxID=329884 RepID=A0A4U0UYM1_9PEZI|nr:hypothetical protein B0A55_13786 [Friedmanniomyces simplex]